MEKDFDGWNTEKKALHASGTAPFYHEREIWWCALGVNIGFEQDGTGRQFDRPVLVLRGFNKSTFVGIGLTGRRKEGAFYQPVGTIEGREATANLSQIRLMDTKRLIRKMGTLDEAVFAELTRKLKIVLFGEL